MKADKIESELVVDPDLKLQKMIKTEWGWRKKIKEGTEDSMVWTFIQSASNLRHERCLEVFMDFGMALVDAKKSIRLLERRGLIEIKDGFIHIKKEKELVYEPEPEEMEQEILE